MLVQFLGVMYEKHEPRDLSGPAFQRVDDSWVYRRPAMHMDPSFTRPRRV